MCSLVCIHGVCFRVFSCVTSGSGPGPFIKVLCLLPMCVCVYVALLLVLSTSATAAPRLLLHFCCAFCGYSSTTITYLLQLWRRPYACAVWYIPINLSLHRQATFVLFCVTLAKTKITGNSIKGRMRPLPA